jgi:SNF2 family DNA or RNA helicase
VCPTSLTYNWLAEVNKFFIGFNAVVLDGSQTQRETIFENLG